MRQEKFRNALILSASFCDEEIEAEFGLLPPAFLPYGQRRLYESQVNELKTLADSLTLTTPIDYEVPPADLLWLKQNEVSLVGLPRALSLGESVARTIETLADDGSLCILHGDTFVPNISSLPLDSVGVWNTPTDYQWGSPPKNEPGKVLVGVFSLGSSQGFLHSLRDAEYNFIEALERYAESSGLENVETPGWLDFGHLHGVFQARRTTDLSREFNRIEFTERTVTKTSDNFEKISAEAQWFETIPGPLRIYTPQLLESSGSRYSLGFEPSPSLSELYLFGRLGFRKWDRIAEASFEFLNACFQHSRNPAQHAVLDLNGLMGKTVARLEDWAQANQVDLKKSWKINGKTTPGLLEIASRANQVLLSAPRCKSSVIHGDFCFSNVFYDSRQEIVRVIDPRGQSFEGYKSIFGDIRYDLAKILHSLEGYDQILAGRFVARRTDATSLDFQLFPSDAANEPMKVFMEKKVGGFSIGDSTTYACVIHLFLGMLPLHKDRPDRQLGFLARALQLWNQEFSLT